MRTLDKRKVAANGKACQFWVPTNVILISVLSILLIFNEIVGVVASPRKDSPTTVKINKCCEKSEILVDSRCTFAKDINTSEFEICFCADFNLYEWLFVIYYGYILWLAHS